MVNSENQTKTWNWKLNVNLDDGYVGVLIYILSTWRSLKSSIKRKNTQTHIVYNHRQGQIPSMLLWKSYIILDPSPNPSASDKEQGLNSAKINISYNGILYTWLVQGSKVDYLYWCGKMYNTTKFGKV